MIRQLRIENFRCLRNVTLELEPFTVFVGANASGKSSVFSALVSAANQRFRPQDRWAFDANAVVRIATQRENRPVEERTFHNQVVGTATFPECQVLQLDVVRMQQVNQVNSMRRLSADGYGLANVFDTLTRRQKDEIARQFCGLVPMYADVDAQPQSSGNHWLRFQDRWHPAVWYEPQDVSDGSILLLAFLLLPYQSPPPDVIAIEEPERGLHPYLMGQLIQLLRRLAKGEIGPRAVQVLLATHSAELLRFVEPKEVRFFSRPKDSGETSVEQAPINDPSWMKTLQEYDNSLGDVWLSGGLGGVPVR